MRRLRPVAELIVVASVVLAGTPAQASFHLWTIGEFFSNADGSVQFIELLSSGSFETQAAGAEIRTTSGGNVFPFPGNLSGNTLNKRLLIATPGFASLPGAVTPDFTFTDPIPTTNFFDLAGDTVRLFSPIFGEFHSRTFSSVPTNGVMSRIYPSDTLALNSPTNFAGDVGLINLTSMIAGDYSGNDIVDAADYTMWRDALEAGSTSLLNDSTPGTVDESDFTYWRAHFGETLGSGAGSAASVPEPSTLVMLFTAALAILSCRARQIYKLVCI